MKVMVDPGHGGTAPGAVNADAEVMEKDITIRVGLLLGALLKQKGYDVSYTRMTDVTFSPSARLDLIKRLQPDCFISIHVDWSSSPSASGFTVIWKDQYDKPLADAVLASMKDIVDLPSRGFLQDGTPRYNRQLAVLKDLEVPSILVELGFLSNEDDLAYIQSNSLVLAKSIADGVEEWVDLIA